MTEGFDPEAVRAKYLAERDRRLVPGRTAIRDLDHDERLVRYRDDPFTPVVERDPVLLEEDVAERQFPGWTMGYAAEDSLRHAEVPGYRTTFDDIDFLPDDHEAGPIVPALRELIRWFRETRPADTEQATAQPA